jgi:hypothetical protein
MRSGAPVARGGRRCCRWALLAALWLQAGSCGGASGEQQSGASTVVDLRAELAAARAKNDQLEAQLEAERERSSRLEAQLASAVRRHEDDAPRARRVHAGATATQNGLASCPLMPIVNESLPRGSYKNSCNSCFRFGDSLRCSCFTRSQASRASSTLFAAL